MKTFYILLDYEDGFVVPDNKIVDFIRNHEHQVLVVGSYLMLLAARVLHKRGEIQVLSILRQGEDLVCHLDKNGRWAGPPGMFDSFLDDFLYELLWQETSQ